MGRTVGIIGDMSIRMSADLAVFGSRADLSGQRSWEVVCWIALLGFTLFFLLAYVGPGLIYQAQEPAFLLDWHMLREASLYPGGINELIGRAFGQIMYIPWLGALGLVGLLAAIAWLARQGGLALGDRPFAPFYWGPSIVLFALHCDYSYPVSLSLGIIWILIGMVLYLRLDQWQPWLRLVIFCLLQTMLYYICAGQAFILAAWIVVYELLRRGTWLAMAILGLSIVMPYILASTIFIIHLPDAYLDGLVRFSGYRLGWLSWLAYGLLMGLTPISQARLGLIGLRLFKGPAHFAIVIIAVVLAASLAYDRDGKRILLIDYYASKRDWDHLLEIGGSRPVNPVYAQYQVNRALYHRGQLCDRMFSFAQYPSRALFLKDQLYRLQPLAHSDIFMDLGLVNEAEHWAYEAAEIKGYTPRVILRLVEVHLLKGQTAMAGKYLSMLSRTIWHRHLAQRYTVYLRDPNILVADLYLGPIQRLMPGWDFLLAPDKPEFCLLELVKDPNNRMAFEYYMAQCLIEGDLRGLVRYLPRLEQLGYSRIPRHIEEAILIWMQVPGEKIPLTKLKVSDQTINRFNAFTDIMTRHRGNRQAAYKELVGYRDTYWFYWQYVLSEARS